MNLSPTRYSQLTEEELKTVISSAECELERRIYYRLSLTTLRQLVNAAFWGARNNNAAQMEHVNNELAALGIRVYADNGQLFVEKVK